MDVGIDTGKTNTSELGASNPGYVENVEQYEMENLNKYDSSSRRGSADTTYVETSFGVDTSVTTPLLREGCAKQNSQNKTAIKANGSKQK